MLRGKLYLCHTVSHLDLTPARGKVNRGTPRRLRRRRPRSPAPVGRCAWPRSGKGKGQRAGRAWKRLDPRRRAFFREFWKKAAAGARWRSMSPVVSGFAEICATSAPKPPPTIDPQHNGLSLRRTRPIMASSVSPGDQLPGLTLFPPPPLRPARARAFARATPRSPPCTSAWMFPLAMPAPSGPRRRPVSPRQRSAEEEDGTGPPGRHVVGYR